MFANIHIYVFYFLIFDFWFILKITAFCAGSGLFFPPVQQMAIETAWSGDLHHESGIRARKWLVEL